MVDKEVLSRKLSQLRQYAVSPDENWCRLVKREIADYFTNKAEVAAVYLFGSQARIRSVPFSDVDIAILIHREYIESAHLKRIEYLTELGRLLKKDIHPVIMNTAGEELLRQIFSTGVCLLVNDQEILSRFKITAFVRIAAFSIYQKQLHKGFIRSLKKEAGIG